MYLLESTFLVQSSAHPPSRPFGHTVQYHFRWLPQYSSLAARLIPCHPLTPLSAACGSSSPHLNCCSVEEIWSSPKYLHQHLPLCSRKPLKHHSHLQVWCTRWWQVTAGSMLGSGCLSIHMPILTRSCCYCSGSQGLVHILTLLVRFSLSYHVCSPFISINNENDKTYCHLTTVLPMAHQ